MCCMRPKRRASSALLSTSNMSYGRSRRIFAYLDYHGAAPFKGRPRLSKPGELADDAFQARHDPCHALEIELVGRVTGGVIVRISEIGGVGEHDGLIADLPERPMVAHAHAVDLRRRGRALRPDGGMREKCLEDAID